MAPPPIFAYDRSGVPVELTGESDWRRAVKRGYVRRDTLVTVFAEGAAPKVLTATQIPELRALLDEVEGAGSPPASHSDRPASHAWGRSAAPSPQLPKENPILEGVRAEDHGRSPGNDRFVPADGPGDSFWGGDGQERGTNGAGPLAFIGAVAIALATVAAIRGCESGGPPVPATPAIPENAASAEPDTAIAAPADYPTSYDCRRASGAAERLICGDSGLAGADLELAALYSRRMREAKDAALRSRHRSAQRLWIERRDRCVGEPDVRPCLERVYAERIAELRTAPAARERPAAAVQNQPRAPTEPAPATAIEKSILCVLPEGGEARLTLQQCRLRAGVVMN